MHPIANSRVLVCLFYCFTYFLGNFVGATKENKITALYKIYVRKYLSSPSRNESTKCLQPIRRCNIFLSYLFNE